MHDNVIEQTGDVARPGLKLKHLLGGYLLEAKSVLNSITAAAPPINQQKFVLFGRGRSGSTVLVSLLDTHPDIRCLGEILRFRVAFPTSYAHRCLGVYPKQAVGFKLLSYQLKTIQTFGQRESMIRRFHDSGFHIVYLRRENLFRHALSNIYARERGVYHSHDRGSTDRSVVHINPEELLAWMRGSLGLYDYEKRLLDGVPNIEITYERDLEDAESQARTYKRIVSALGLPTHEAEVKLKKVTPRSISSFVSNAQEIRDAVWNSPFRAHLTDVEL